MTLLSCPSLSRTTHHPWLSPQRQAGIFLRRCSRWRLALTQSSALKEDEDWVTQNAELLRAVPLAAGALGVAGVLVNRLASGVRVLAAALSQIAPVVTASSAQSRTDVLVIVLSAVLMLTGLQWLSLRPRAPVQVEPEGREVAFLAPGLPAQLQEELLWAWQAVRSATRARSFVVFHGGRCVAQLGVMTEGATAGSPAPGPICKQALESGRGNYLANLVLFPGRVEFAGYLPFNMQAALIQPIGDQGVMVVGSDTQRGFSRLDQAWVAALGEKLDVAFDKALPAKQ